ncbi:hypothetical protein AB0B25_01975 [Nocardia sp. NPDC049190]|uniref:hypothetical protein n=1 Tax=Nocardia sp. NPDC049190 TaxID=3155650 RepID=UPI0033FC6DCF
MTEPNTEHGAYVSADDLLDDRRDWLAVHIAEVEPNCFDIMLKIDGTYYDRETAVEVAVSFQRDIEHLLGDLDPDRLLVPPNDAA